VGVTHEMDEDILKVFIWNLGGGQVIRIMFTFLLESLYYLKLVITIKIYIFLESINEFIHNTNAEPQRGESERRRR